MVDEGTSSSGGELTLDPPAPVRRSRRTALWGALAAVAVAAGALAVTSGGGSDDLPQLPVALGADGGAAGREAAMSADMSMAAWVTYLAGDGLPALGGEAPAYRVTGTIDEDSVGALADVLGMEGDPTEQDGYWHLESGDAVLDVYPGTGGAWSYWVDQGTDLAVGSGSTSSRGSEDCTDGTITCSTTAPAPDDAPVVDCEPATKCAEPTAPVATPATSPCPPDAMCTLPVEECPPNAECTVPEPVRTTVPVDLPSEDEAREIALDLLAATGMDVADAKVTVDGPYDAWYVNVEPTVDGTPVGGWYASVSVGSEGTVLNANGTLTDAERLGDYPVLDTTAAIDRLNAQQGDWRAYPVDEDLSARSGAASDSASASSEDSPASAPAAGTSQSETVVTTLERIDQCKEQPDGRDICEPVATDPGECTPIVPGQTPDGEVPAIAQCVEPVPMPVPEPMPLPEPEPIEVVLTEAERILVLLPAVDDSGDSYLVPGYRFGGEDGTIVDVAAVADESLAPTTTVGEETPQTEPAGAPVPSQECEVLTEDDGSGTTHTVQTCPGEIEPSDPELRHLAEGETPELGVPYYVDGVNTHCGTFVWAGRWWATDESTPLPWSVPTEGGSFTLATPDEGTFVGDAAGTKVANFAAQGPAAEIPGCA